MPSRNLEPGQMQIGDFVFGFNTLFTIEDRDFGGYDVNVQDYAAQLSDETRFGSDSLKPLPIQLQLNAFQNRLLPHIAAITGDDRELNFDDDPTVGQFTREWRADDVRHTWGELKPLYVCRPDGSTVMVYGRPGKCSVSKPDKEGARKVVAEFRRSDTLCYNEFEWFTQVQYNEQVTVWRSTEMGQGDAPCWMRFFLVGPMTNPSITFGDLTIDLNYKINYGEIVEISSYPWERRAIRLNDGLSLNAYVTQPYLENIIFDIDKPINMKWIASDTNTAIENEIFADYPNTSEGLNSEKWSASAYSASGSGKWYINTDGVLVWSDSGNQSHSVTSIYQGSQTISKYQMVGFTTNHPAEDNTGINGTQPTNRIIGRSNAAGTEYLYWDISYTNAWFGYHGPDGVEHILSPKYQLHKPIGILRRILNNFGTIFGNQGNPSDGWQYDAEFGTGAGLLSSTLHINNVKVLDFDQTVYQNITPGTGPQPAGAVSVTADNHYFINTITLGDDSNHCGIGMRATPRGLGQATPAGITEFHMRDNPIEPLNISAVYMMWRDAWQNI